MPRDEATVDRIFAGNLDDLPPLSSKVMITDLFLNAQRFKKDFFICHYYFFWYYDSTNYLSKIIFTFDI